MLTTVNILEVLVVGMCENGQILVAVQKRSLDGLTIAIVMKLSYRFISV